jgi:predicted esterase
LEIDTLEAPFEEGKGKAWWTTNPEGARSYEADKYEGFEESKEMVVDALNSAEEPYDLVVGHSQGAMMAASVLAQEGGSLQHPTVGYVFNGLAWPKPFTEELESMDLGSSGKKPKILLVTGMRDKVNPPEQAEQMKESFKKAGAEVSSVKHPTGHSVPIQKDATVKVIMDWIVDNSS